MPHDRRMMADIKYFLFDFQKRVGLGYPTQTPRFASSSVQRQGQAQQRAPSLLAVAAQHTVFLSSFSQFKLLSRSFNPLNSVQIVQHGPQGGATSSSLHSPWPTTSAKISSHNIPRPISSSKKTPVAARRRPQRRRILSEHGTWRPSWHTRSTASAHHAFGLSEPTIPRRRSRVGRLP